MDETGYAMHRTLPGVSYEAAVERVTQALQAEGFGILTTIDVSATLREKLDVAFRPYVILGACNPGLAHRALSADDNLGLLLPCNVVVAEAEDGAEISIARPQAMLEIAENASIQPIADEAEERLGRALAAV